VWPALAERERHGRANASLARGKKNSTATIRTMAEQKMGFLAGPMTMELQCRWTRM